MKRMAWVLVFWVVWASGRHASNLSWERNPGPIVWLESKAFNTKDELKKALLTLPHIPDHAMIFGPKGKIDWKRKPIYRTEKKEVEKKILEGYEVEIK